MCMFVDKFKIIKKVTKFTFKLMLVLYSIVNKHLYMINVERGNE